MRDLKQADVLPRFQTLLQRQISGATCELLAVKGNAPILLPNGDSWVERALIKSN